MVFYLSLVHILAFVGLFRYLTSCKWETWVWSLILVFWTEVGITGGAHRLWSHRSYHAHWTVRLFYMLLASIANEGSIYHWVRDHRTHHKYSETDADPHNVSITVCKCAKRLKTNTFHWQTTIPYRHSCIGRSTEIVLYEY